MRKIIALLITAFVVVIAHAESSVPTERRLSFEAGLDQDFPLRFGYETVRSDRGWFSEIRFGTALSVPLTFNFIEAGISVTAAKYAVSGWGAELNIAAGIGFRNALFGKNLYLNGYFTLKPGYFGERSDIYLSFTETVNLVQYYRYGEYALSTYPERFGTTDAPDTEGQFLPAHYIRAGIGWDYRFGTKWIASLGVGTYFIPQRDANFFFNRPDFTPLYITLQIQYRIGG